MPEKKRRRYTGIEEKIINLSLRIFGGGLNVWVYRLTGGRLLGHFPGGLPIILLTTIGRKTGKRRTSPLLYLREGNRYLVVASKGGVSQHPAWFNNLTTNPNVTVEDKSRRFDATAHVATPQERAEAWPRLVAHYPGYATYQSRTDREIPVVVVTPK